MDLKNDLASSYPVIAFDLKESKCGMIETRFSNEFGENNRDFQSISILSVCNFGAEFK